MADRRMLTKKVTDDDHFLELSASAQALYLHLSMSADDDGFCNQVSVSMFKAHASVQDLQALLENRYIYQFENGVIVIKHWRMANALRKDRYTPTTFQKEFAQLQMKENGSYTMAGEQDGNHSATKRQPLGNQTATQYRIDKKSIDKGSISLSGDNARAKEKPVKHKYGAYNNVLLTDEELDKLKTEFPKDWDDRIERLSEYIESKGTKYKSHYATIKSWARRDSERTINQQRTTSNSGADALEDFYAMTKTWAEGGSET